MATFDLSKLSPEERELLLEAAQDRGGYIIVTEAGGEFFVEANGREFVEKDGPRSAAFWDMVLERLANMGLIKRRGGIGYRLTQLGYEVADLLTAG